uniref:Uncharacterized protein n=1 Tax=Anguilla anguilla TaxID=7936 RepID=A0A0E9W4V5_ANGAN
MYIRTEQARLHCGYLGNGSCRSFERKDGVNMQMSSAHPRV